MKGLLLAIVDRLRWLVCRLGVDYPQFRAILETKLTLDGRRTMGGLRRKAGHAPKNTFVVAVVFYAFLGVLASGALAACGSPLVGMTLVFAFIMVMVGMTLIADFSSVLLDVTDNMILQPRPVSGRTILAARIAHIAAYLGTLSFGLSAAPTVVGAMTIHPLVLLLMPVMLLFAAGFVVALVNVFYLFVMRWTTQERMRDIIANIQIVMTVVIMGGYQVLPRLMDVRSLRTLDISHRWWIYLAPPAWFAAPFDLLVGRAGTPQVVLTLMSVVLPAAGLVLVVRVLAPRFNQALAALGTESSSAPAAVHVAERRRSWPERLARAVGRDPQERAAFELTWRLCARDRQFKLRTYPSLAMMFIVAVMFVFVGPSRGDAPGLHRGPDARTHLVVLYLACMAIPAPVLQLRYSDKYEAAWIYDALPIARPGGILAGGLKAVMLRTIAPAYGVLALLCVVLWGPRTILDAAMVFGVMICMCVLVAFAAGRRMPFSEQLGVMEGAGRFSLALVTMLVPMAVGILHWGLTYVPFGVAIATLAAILLGGALMDNYRRTTWARVRG